MYQHHTDKRPLSTMLAASNRMISEKEASDPIRALAVAVIGDALYDLTGRSRSNNQGHKFTPKTFSDRIRNAWEFINGPNLESWAQCTSISAEQWREIARRVAG